MGERLIANDGWTTGFEPGARKFEVLKLPQREAGKELLLRLAWTSDFVPPSGKNPVFSLSLSSSQNKHGIAVTEETVALIPGFRICP